MYKLMVPVMSKTLQRAGREKIVSMLKKMGAERVFLVIDAYITEEEELQEELGMLRENCSFLKDNGFEAGAWMLTFMLQNDKEYVHMTSPAGDVSQHQVCPSDERFREMAGQYIRKVAECGVDLIMFDDDFRYGCLDIGLGCTCKNHLRHMSETLGEEVKTEGLSEKLLTGGRNKYRSAWLKANRQMFVTFAEEMRRNVDLVDPKIRLGLCACMSTWDFDGISAAELSRILAGNTKPFLRLIGAPYWADGRGWGNRLQDTVELERMERSWCGEGIEIFAEGDVYPRPRTACPSSYLEGFDTALRADGRLDGILKYVMDYYSGADYEKGYVNAHLENQKL